MAPPRDESLPSLDALVVVEGFNDCLALHKAVRAPVSGHDTAKSDWLNAHTVD